MSRLDWNFSFLLLLTLLSTLAIAGNVTVKHPVILIPGMAGSQAYRVTRDGETNQLWLNLWDAIWGEQFIKDLTTRDQPGIRIDFPGWGETWSCEYLDNSTHRFDSYMHPLLAALKTDPFYVSNKTLRTAPYDFRKATWELGDFNERLKVLIEQTFANADNRRVVLVAHSLGCIHLLHFLHLQPGWWKAKYVKSFISLGGPYGGSIKSVLVQARGYNMGVWLRYDSTFRSMERRMSSLAQSMPQPRLTLIKEPLVVTPDSNYTIDDFQRYFQDIGSPNGYAMMTYAQQHLNNSVGPDAIADIYCVHGIGMPTPIRYIYQPPTFYRSAFPDQWPSFAYGDGDGSVQLDSLELCSQWPDTNHVKLQGADHYHMVQDERVLRLVMRVAGADQGRLHETLSVIGRMHFPAFL